MSYSASHRLENFNGPNSFNHHNLHATDSHFNSIRTSKVPQTRRLRGTLANCKQLKNHKEAARLHEPQAKPKYQTLPVTVANTGLTGGGPKSASILYVSSSDAVAAATRAGQRPPSVTERPQLMRTEVPRTTVDAPPDTTLAPRAVVASEIVCILLAEGHEGRGLGLSRAWTRTLGRVLKTK